MANVTADMIVNAAREKGIAISEETKTSIQLELGKIDQNIIQLEEENKLTYEIWDKVSPVNGVPAEKLLSRSDVDVNSEIYLIKDANTGKVLYFQPHAPGEIGFVRMKTKAEAESAAKKHRFLLAEARANARIIKEVLSKFNMQ